jgi:hypothetical protein
VNALSGSRVRENRQHGCASSEGWCIQQEENLPGQESEPCSLGSGMAGNQDAEAYRQPYRKDKCEILGRNASEHRGGSESAASKVEPATVRVKTTLGIEID